MRCQIAVVAFVLLCGRVPTAMAQFSTPGTQVGNGFNLGSAGTKNNPNVGAPAGNQVGNGIGGSIGASQDFSNIDPKQLAAPLPQFPGIGGSPTFWDRTKQKVLSIFGATNSTTPSGTVPKPNWVPGISRRNRDRHENRMFRPD